MSQDYADRMLAMLRAAGRRGVPNYELSKVSLQYNFTIHTLRHKRGYDIRKYRVSRGIYFYYLVEAPKPAPLPPVAAPKVEQSRLLDVPVSKQSGRSL